MELLPVRAIKIVSDFKILFREAHTSNEDVWSYQYDNIQREYTFEEKNHLSKYNIKEIGTAIGKIKQKKDKIKYFTDNIAKEDKSIVLTELVTQGFYQEESLGNIKLLSVFQHTSECICCKEKQEPEYLSTSKSSSLCYEESQCPKCSHNNIHPVCDCKYCSEKWEKAIEKLKEFDEFFNEKYLIVNVVNARGFSISSVEDFYIFLDLIKRGDIYPSQIFSIVDANNGETILYMDEIYN